MGRICFFPTCDPKHRDFVVFPFRRSPEFESWWIKSGWSNLLSTKKLPDKILICEAHFDESLINRRYKVPRLAFGALPSRNIDCPAKKIVPKTEPTGNEVLLHRLFCRLCGEMQETNLDEDAPLLENLDDILRHLQLSDSILLPMGVCAGCKDKAEFVLRFWQECNDAQDNLRVIFNQDHTVELLTTEIPADDYQHLAQDDTCQTVEISPEVEIAEHDYDSRSDIFDIIPKEEPYCHESETVEIESVPKASLEPPAASALNSTTETIVEQKPSTDNSVICEICGKLLRSRAALNLHFKSHSSERAHSCSTCGKRFRQRRALIEHVQSKHENRLFPCRVCGEIYRWQKGLDRHMKIHKGNQAKHPCNVCDKTFPHPHQLKRHMMLHSGDRIYCDVCGKGYRFNYMLTQHKIREHNMQFEGVKLYTKPHLRNKNIRKRIKKEPEQQLKQEYTEEVAAEIVEYDSIAIDINPVDGSEISRETYIVEHIDDNHHLQA